MQHFKALRTRTMFARTKFAISLILGFVMVSFGCTSGGGSGDFIYEGTDTITITKYTGAGGDVTIPAKINGKPVTGIGEYAFYDCDTVTGVTIPYSVTAIGDHAFYDCDTLTVINVHAANTAYCSEDGILYNKDKTALIKYPTKKTDSTFTIPYGVTDIGIGAFYDCDTLANITIPDSVTSIGDHAFFRCKSLTSVSIPASVTSLGERNYAFAWCDSLTEINVDAANTMYNSEDGILYNKEKTVLILYPAGKTTASFTIPNSVTSIGFFAFWMCNNLTGITVPAGVISIRDGANNSDQFTFCYNLTAINVDAANTMYSSEDGILYNKKKTVLIRYPAGKTDASFTIPNSVTGIGFMSFSICKNLSGVIIPNSVTSIENGAFLDCDSLKSITIPDSVTSIEEMAFSELTNLTAINVDTANTAYISEDGILYNKAKTVLVQYPAGKTAASFTIPDSVTSIGVGAFGGTSLTKITIPNSVTIIDERAFYNCASLENITIPDSVTSIGHSAFNACASLTSVTIPNSVTSIGCYTFAGCTNLESVTFEGTIASDNLGFIWESTVYSPFDGDLRDKYLILGTRTYTTTKPVTGSSTWAMQQSILEKLIRIAYTVRSAATSAANTSPEV